MRVSIIVPYNHDRGFLERCVASIEAQTVPCELILSQSLNSVAYNINRGLELVDTELVKIVGEDDWLPEDSIENLLEIGDAPWAVGDATNVYGLRTELYLNNNLDFSDNIELNRIHNGGTIYRTDILREIGGMDESLWTAEEYEMHLRLFSKGYLPKYINKNVYFYRQHSGQKYKKLNRDDREKRRAEIKRIQSLYSDAV